MFTNIIKSISVKLGPGILFAAASVGTSHLVQSTRAGANYGLALWSLIILSCLIKYPAFRSGADYAAATGTSLLDNYFRQGHWAIIVFTIELLVTMFIATAAVSLVTAGIISTVFQLQLNNVAVAGVLLTGCALLLISGKYHLFERVTLVFVILFSLLIFLAVSLTLPALDWQASTLLPPTSWDRGTILFMIAIAGWMPTAMGVSVFQSLWVCAKSKDLGRPVTPVEARFDFDLGYISAAFLALCFLVLGTVLMFQNDIPVANSANGFAEQLISLFTGSIGKQAYPVIGTMAIIVMLSTVLTMIDACPRALGVMLSYRKHSASELLAETVEERIEESVSHENRYYALLVVVQCMGALCSLTFFMHSFKTFIDFATSVAFLTAPLLAYLNYRAMHSAEVPEHLRPSTGLRIWSIVAIAVLGLTALCYVYYVVWQ